MTIFVVIFGVIYVFFTEQNEDFVENIKIENSSFSENINSISIETTESKSFVIETTVSKNDKIEQSEIISDDGKININSANEQLLTTLPSIGPTIAKAIIEYRNQNGKFTNIDQIKKVKRIGEKTFEKIKNKITVG